MEICEQGRRWRIIYEAEEDQWVWMDGCFMLQYWMPVRRTLFRRRIVWGWKTIALSYHSKMVRKDHVWELWFKVADRRRTRQKHRKINKVPICHAAYGESAP